MKILTVVHSLGKGGTERSAVNFAISYLRNGHDSRLLYTDKSGPRELDCRDNSVLVYCFFDIAILRDLQFWGPDVIHVHSHGLKSFQVEFLHSICPSADIIETNVFSTPSPWEHLLTKSYQLSHWCLWLYGQRGGNIHKACVVPNPVNCDNFYAVPKNEITRFRSKYGIGPDSFLIGRIGQAYDGKWSPLIIQAFEKVLDYRPNAQLMLVNPPQSIVNLANTSKAASQIIIISQLIGDEELRQAYSSIDVFLHAASQGESFGMALAESLLCETPVITLATPWGDNSQLEVSPNRICGFCVDSRLDLYKALKMLICDDSLRERLGRQGRSFIKTKYNSKYVALSAIDSIGLAPASGLMLPSALYRLENRPNKLVLLMIDKYDCRHLLYYACNLSTGNILRLLFYASILLLKLISRSTSLFAKNSLKLALKSAKDSLSLLT